jgi:hypothetical protein
MMLPLSDVAPAFVEMAHRIVWCSAATVDSRGRPRSRILHPIWIWEGDHLVGWIATDPTPVKRSHLDAHPYMSLSYWAPSQETCVAECRAALVFDDETRTMVWNLFLQAPPPLGYDPQIIPSWKRPTVDSFATVRLEPWRLRVLPAGGGDVLRWQEEGSKED